MPRADRLTDGPHEAEISDGSTGGVFRALEQHDAFAPAGCREGVGEADNPGTDDCEIYGEVTHP